jgi:polysaccharide biosynthesis transport protein
MTTRATASGLLEHISPLQVYLDVLKAHWLQVFAVFVLTVASGVLFASWQTSVFQGAATVLIEPEPPRVMNIQDVAADNARSSTSNYDYYLTQYRLLQSRAVVEPVISELKLKQRMAHVGRARDPYSTFMTWENGGLTIEPVKNTRLVLVRFDDPNPDLAVEIANAVAAQFVKYGLDNKQREAQTATAWLGEQIEKLRVNAQQSSDALQAYQAKANLLGVQDQRQITQAKLVDFNRAYLEAQNQRLAAESKLRELNRIAKDPTTSETLSSVVNDPLIQKLKTQASDLSIERSKLAEMYRPKHPDLLEIDAQLQQVKQRLKDEVQKTMRAVETEASIARGREESLLAHMNDLRREARVLNEREAQAFSLQREKETADELQVSVLKRLKETGLASALTASNIRVVERATRPTSPVRPRKQLIWALSGMAGLALGVGVAFLSESLDNRIRSRDEIERVLGVPVLGVVPVFRQRRG